MRKRRLAVKRRNLLPGRIARTASGVQPGAGSTEESPPRGAARAEPCLIARVDQDVVPHNITIIREALDANPVSLHHVALGNFVDLQSVVEHRLPTLPTAIPRPEIATMANANTDPRALAEIRMRSSSQTAALMSVVENSTPAERATSFDAFNSQLSPTPGRSRVE